MVFFMNSDRLSRDLVSMATGRYTQFGLVYKFCTRSDIKLGIYKTKNFNFFVCSLRLKHPGLIYYSDLLDMSWHKGLHDSDLLVTYRYHRPRDMGPPSLTIKVCTC